MNRSTLGVVRGMISLNSLPIMTVQNVWALLTVLAVASCGPREGTAARVETAPQPPSETAQAIGEALTLPRESERSEVLRAERDRLLALPDAHAELEVLTGAEAAPPQRFLARAWLSRLSDSTAASSLDQWRAPQGLRAYHNPAPHIRAAAREAYSAHPYLAYEKLLLAEPRVRWYGEGQGLVDVVLAQTDGSQAMTALITRYPRAVGSVVESRQGRDAALARLESCIAVDARPCHTAADGEEATVSMYLQALTHAVWPEEAQRDRYLAAMGSVLSKVSAAPTAAQAYSDEIEAVAHAAARLVESGVSVDQLVPAMRYALQRLFVASGGSVDPAMQRLLDSYQLAQSEAEQEREVNEWMASQDVPPRLFAAFVLGNRADEEARSRLLVLATDTDIEVRRSAVYALERSVSLMTHAIGDQEAEAVLGAVERAAGSRDTELRRRAVHAGSRLLAHGTEEVQARWSPRIHRLVVGAALEDPVEEIRSGAVPAFWAVLGEDQAVAMLGVLGALSKLPDYQRTRFDGNAEFYLERADAALPQLRQLEVPALRPLLQNYARMRR